MLFESLTAFCRDHTAIMLVSNRRDAEPPQLQPSVRGRPARGQARARDRGPVPPRRVVRARAAPTTSSGDVGSPVAAPQLSGCCATTTTRLWRPPARRDLAWVRLRGFETPLAGPAKVRPSTAAPYSAPVERRAGPGDAVARSRRRATFRPDAGLARVAYPTASSLGFRFVRKG
jgi:hypothetical protein